MNSQQKPSVAAVVISYNSAADITTCLNSLLSQSFPVDSVIVLDNASCDHTADIVAEKCPGVKLIRRTDNEGFARGNNLAIAETRSDWILTLNPDTELTENYLEKLVEFAMSHPRVGALMGKLIRETGSTSGKSFIDSTGIEIYYSRRVKDRSAGFEDDGSWQNPEKVFGVCAAAALYCREMLNDISPDGEIFAESFFSYYEDADIAWRAWRRGWEAWFIPEAECLHKRGGSSVGSRFSRVRTHRNRLWLIARNEPLLSICKHPLSLLLHEILIILRMVRYPYLFLWTVKALAGLPRAIKYRKSLPSTNDVPPPFKPGTGFGRDDLKKALKRKKKFPK
ncbi:glycosyltransferase family 2 protein [bacterium]|nr:glycosyltransferase family 2 protein [bacterium]